MQPAPIPLLEAPVPVPLPPVPSGLFDQAGNPLTIDQATVQLQRANTPVQVSAEFLDAAGAVILTVGTAIPPAIAANIVSVRRA